ncbi:hypothetical protein AACB05_00050, partial [Enterococcus faecalis]|uniref:hypothetical protein n=1 Tax=Enterococcus faecalis TaxID=1351 RepID=UPI0031711E42
QSLLPQAAGKTVLLLREFWTKPQKRWGSILSAGVKAYFEKKIKEGGRPFFQSFPETLAKKKLFFFFFLFVWHRGGGKMKPGKLLGGNTKKTPQTQR